MTTETIDRIKAHYEHAKEKHPFFAMGIINPSWKDYMCFKHDLEIMRNLLANREKGGGAFSTEILNCEIAEILEAYTAGRLADAKEECYDAIAVLLRMIDMIDAEQKESPIEEIIADIREAGE